MRLIPVNRARAGLFILHTSGGLILSKNIPPQAAKFMAKKDVLAYVGDLCLFLSSAGKYLYSYAGNNGRAQLDKNQYGICTE